MMPRTPGLESISFFAAVSRAGVIKDPSGASDLVTVGLGFAGPDGAADPLGDTAGVDPDSHTGLGAAHAPRLRASTATASAGSAIFTTGPPKPPGVRRGRGYPAGLSGRYPQDRGG